MKGQVGLSLSLRVRTTTAGGQREGRATRSKLRKGSAVGLDVRYEVRGVAKVGVRPLGEMVV